MWLTCLLTVIALHPTTNISTRKCCTSFCRSQSVVGHCVTAKGDEAEMPLERLDWLARLDRSRASPQAVAESQRLVYSLLAPFIDSGHLAAVSQTSPRRVVKYRPTNHSGELACLSCLFMMADDTSDDRSAGGTSNSSRPRPFDAVAGKHHAWSAIGDAV